MKTKVVYIMGGLWSPSGMERVITLKANYLAEVLGYDVYIILSEDRGLLPFYPLSKQVHLINLSVDFDLIYSLPFYKKVLEYMKKQFIYKRKLKKILFEIRPQITISTLRREINFLNSIKDGSIKIGEIHFSKANYRDFKNNKFPVFIQKTVGYFWMNQLIRQLKKLKCFVVLTEEDKSLWTELTNVHVINNPFSFLPSKYSSCCEKKIIAVGRYSYQKGFDMLIEMWSIVSIKYPEWKLYIYGGGDKEPYQKIVNEKGLGNTLVCEGPTKNIEEKYWESSIFVLSSRYEGLPMVLLEAMACGLPIVSFACPCGPKDLITDGVNGLLVENGNVMQLAEKVGYLIENSEIRKKMGGAAKENIERFRIEKIAKEWQKLFDSLIEETPN